MPRLDLLSGNDATIPIASMLQPYEPVSYLRVGEQERSEVRVSQLSQIRIVVGEQRDYDGSGKYSNCPQVLSQDHIESHCRASQ